MRLVIATREGRAPPVLEVTQRLRVLYIDGISLETHADGFVNIDFTPRVDNARYVGIRRGGVIVESLDAAMADCPFAHRRCSVATELRRCHRYPVQSANPSVVPAWSQRAREPPRRPS